MCNYLKNMEGKKVKDLKNKSFDSIQKLFDKAIKRVNTFVDMDTELVEGNDYQEEAKMKELMEIVPDEEEVAINAIPLDTKPPTIERIVEIKRLHDDLEVIAVKVRVAAAKQNLVLFSNLNEKYAK
ncbi:hypothetical protein Tco_0934355 [Tanacetum coccineum]